MDILLTSKWQRHLHKSKVSTGLILITNVADVVRVEFIKISVHTGEQGKDIETV